MARSQAHSAAVRAGASLGLSPREADVLLWIAQGKADAEIAVILDLSVRTIHHHVGHLLTKLRVESRPAAAMAYEAWRR